MKVSSIFMLEKLKIIGLLMENAYFQPSTYLIVTRLKISKHLKCEVGVEELRVRCCQDFYLMPFFQFSYCYTCEHIWVPGGHCNPNYWEGEM